MNGQDISLAASHWLQSGTNIPGDANGDGIVNGQDVALMASNWLQSVNGGSSGGGNAVPEPSAIALSVLGFMTLSCLIGLRRSGSSRLIRTLAGFVVCALPRHVESSGAIPDRRSSSQPEALGAVQEVTNGLKHSQKRLL